MGQLVQLRHRSIAAVGDHVGADQRDQDDGGFGHRHEPDLRRQQSWQPDRQSYFLFAAGTRAALMPSIRIQNFGGIAPRISPRLLAGGSALRAEMTKLWSGEIRPFINKVKLDDALAQGDMVQTIYKFKDVWLSWLTDVDVVTGFTVDRGSERLYYTGDGTPKVTTYPLAVASLPPPTNSFDLGVRQPLNPPTL